MPARIPPQPRSDLRERLTTLKVLLDRASSHCKCDRAKPLLAEGLDVLESVLGQVGPAPGSGRGPRHAKTVQAYVVERHGGESMLAEYRSSRPQPFRCPEVVFAACVEVLHRADHTQLKFADLRSQAEKRLGRRQPIYLFRISLRFLLWAGLIQHRQARFWTKRQDFKAAVRQEWERAASRTPPTQWR